MAAVLRFVLEAINTMNTEYQDIVYHDSLCMLQRVRHRVHAWMPRKIISVSATCAHHYSLQTIMTEEVFG